MAQISILSGIFMDTDPAFRHAYPINMVPVLVPKPTGISAGYLRPGDGLVKFGDALGNDRGGIDWQGVLYRVQGSSLVAINAQGGVDRIGDVENDGLPVTMVYSFDHLAIASNKKLWLYDKSKLGQVTDGDLGDVLSVLYIDGYFMTTDGEFLVVTELNDPFEVNPFKYGSSEVDPDPIVQVLEFRNEVYAINTNTIEVFDNQGATTNFDPDDFPFRRIPSAQIDKGAVGSHAACILNDIIAFVGGGRNEAVGVYLGLSGKATKVSTAEIDELLASYTTTEMSNVYVEARIDRHHNYMYIHLPDKTLVFDMSVSLVAKERVWFILRSGGTYRARSFIRIFEKWVFGDPSASRTGYLVEHISSHFDEKVSWQFNTAVIYNESRGAIVHEIELVALGGQIELGKDPVITTEWSADGLVWSQPKTVRIGKVGERNRRIRWFKQGRLRDRRMQRFKGTSDAHASFARLEVRMEDLAW